MINNLDNLWNQWLFFGLIYGFNGTIGIISIIGTITMDIQNCDITIVPMSYGIIYGINGDSWIVYEVIYA